MFTVGCDCAVFSSKTLLWSRFEKTKIRGECFATGYKLVFGYLVGEYDLRLVAQGDTKDGLSGSKDGLSGPKDGLSGSKDGLSGPKDGLSGPKDGLSGSKDGLSGIKLIPPNLGKIGRN